MASTEVLFKSIVDEFISPLLKSAGFKKSGQTWNRNTNGIIHVINSQKSQWSDSDETRFTINIGILVRPIYQIIEDKEPAKIVSESSCFPCFRIGYLPGVDVGKDIWWELHSSSEPESIKEIGNEIACLIKDKCLPLLDCCQTIPDVLAFTDKVEKWYHASEKLSLAVMMCLGGREERGQALFDELESNEKLKSWHPRIKEARTRLRSLK